MSNSSTPNYPMADFMTARDWHIYYVYNDGDFKKDIHSLQRDYDKLERAEAANHSKRLFPDWFRLAEGHEWERLKDKYCIKDFDLAFYLKGYAQKGLANMVTEKTMGKVYIDKESSMIRVTLLPTITYDGFMEIWQKIKAGKQEFNLPQKRKQPLYPELIYAIFKARERYKFSEIFKMYSQGDLEGYKGSGDTFHSEDSLERYYDKYKPSLEADT